MTDVELHDGGDGLEWTSATKLAASIRSGTLSSVELTEHLLGRIDELDPMIHAYLTLDHDLALAEAATADERMARGEDLGPLHGVPVSIKDQFWSKGMRCTGGSLVFDEFVPEQDSVHAERLRTAGCVVIGKTNTPEFGLFVRSVNRVGEETVNPWDPDRTSGGSSGGAAAAVAAGLGPIAVGSDGGGSIRLPAAFNGVFGLHPSDGRVPRHGSFGGALFCSGVGPITRTVRDGAVMFQAMAGADRRDPTSMRTTPPDYLARLDDGVHDMRLGWTPDMGVPVELSADAATVVDAAADAAMVFTGLGATVDAAEMSMPDHSVAFGTISGSDRYASLGESCYDDPLNRPKLSDYTLEMFSQARGVSGVDYSKALKVRYLLWQKYAELFEEWDLLVAPTVAMTAQPIATWPAGAADFHDYSRLTSVVNFVGLCAASVPCGFVDGLPVGLQVIGPPDSEDRVLRACRAFEVARPWADVRPELRARL